MKHRVLLAAGLILSGLCGSIHADVDPLGRQVANFELQDFRGKVCRLEDYRDSRVVVIAFLGTECPLAKLYAPRLVELSREFADRGVQFVGMMSNRQDSVSEIAAFARRHEIPFPILKDLGNQVADQMSATRTPEVFVLDPERRIRYWGRIDDQYGIGVVRERPEQQSLRAAIDGLLAGRDVTAAHVPAIGCLIGRVRSADPDSPVTYSNQVARILQKRCVECHRAGEIAPFALTEYDEVAGWADMIAEVVSEHRMPPWHAAEGDLKFQNDRRLTDEEQQTLFEWVAAGAPQGDPADLPQPIQFAEGWQLPRKPDFVAAISDEPFRVKAEGAVRYQYFQIDPGFEEDKWVQAIEIQPGNRAVVHHVLMFARSMKEVEGRLGGGARGYDAIYVPGQRTRPYPEGTARRIPQGSRLVFQVHYTPIGTEQFDQSRVGMWFVDPDTVEFEVRTESAVNAAFEIPPEDPGFRVDATSPGLPADARLLSFTPHMHLRGKSFRYDLVTTDGTPRTLLDVPRYDFNWQTAYRLQEPLVVPAGSRFHCVAEFDNSADNLNNPEPGATVTWGEQTWNEMMIGYYDYAVPRGAAEKPKSRAQLLFERLDANGDGKVVEDEVPARFRQLFGTLDRDGNGSLDVDELSRAARR